MTTRPIVPPGFGASEEVMRRMIPIPRGRTIGRNVGVNESILPVGIKASYPSSLLRITAAFRTSTALRAIISDGSKEEAVYLNSGQPLGAGSVYAFDLPVAMEDVIVFKPATSTYVMVFEVSELGV